MKLKGLLILFLLPLSILTLSSCDVCTETGTIDLDGDNQSITIQYVTSGGVTINPTPDKTTIAVNTEGGVGSFALVDETEIPVGGGVIGPINYTRLSRDPAVMGQVYDHWYIIQVDTFIVDTLRVNFIPTADECHEFFRVLNFYRNGELQAESGSQVANFTWVE